jgi:hypothetical protein
MQSLALQEESLCWNPENDDSIPTTGDDDSTGKRVFAGTRKTTTLYRRRLCSSDDSTTAMALLGRESLPEPGKRRLYTDYWEESLCRNPENDDSIPTTTLQQRLHNGDGSTGKRVFAGTRKTTTLYRRHR